MINKNGSSSMRWHKNISTQNKTFAFITVLLIAFLFIIIYHFKLHKEERLEEIQANSYKVLKVFYDHLVQDYQSFYNYVLLEQRYSNTVKEAFYKRDRDKLFRLSNILWNRIKKEDISSNLIHYHLPDGTSFLRMHEPLKHDDNISALRTMPWYVHQYQKTAFGFEKGIYKLAYRAFTPLFYKKSILELLNLVRVPITLSKDF